VWFVPQGLSAAGFFWALLLVYGLSAAAHKLAYVPYMALGMELSTDYHGRTRVQLYRVLLGALVAGPAVGSVLYLASGPLFDDTVAGFRVVGPACCIVAMVCYGATFFGTGEARGAAKVRLVAPWSSMLTVFRNTSFLILLVALLAVTVGIMWAVPLVQYVVVYHVCEGDLALVGILALLGQGVITSGVQAATVHASASWMTRRDKRTAFLVCIVLIGFAFGSTWLVMTPVSPYLTLAFSALLAVPLNGLMMLPYSMLADLCDEDELNSGTRREGAYAGVLSMVMKGGNAVTPSLAGFTLHAMNIAPGAETQPEQATLGLRFAVVAIPLAFLAGAFALFLLYPLSQARVHRIQRELAAAHVVGSRE
jgi:GPH family glycoside/pentoside/hexuronide:cation symporter